MSNVLKIHSNRQSSYAFVLPRYFEGIAGGAETLSGALAQKLAQRGDKVEILTTCARDNRSFENFFPPGKSCENGIDITRFVVDHRNLDKWIPKQISISQGMHLSVEDQLEWMEHGVNSTALYQDLLFRSDKFDALFFAPYLFATTFWGSLMVPEKSILIPCLHDECYAYQDVISSMFRQVRGALFNAEAERRLACSLYGDILGGEVGMGFEPFTQEYINSLEPFFQEKFPYVLYLGRKETGKNVQLLIDYFIAAKHSSKIDPNLKLVILGGGDFSDLHREESLERGDIVDLAHLSELDKQRVVKHAMVLCQPSVNESFSIVLMEAWLLGVPVLVHSSCAVTKEHVIESGGGLFFGDENEFKETLILLTSKPTVGREFGQAGMSYVKKKYSWDRVLSRFDKVVKQILNVPIGDSCGEDRGDKKEDSRAS